MPPTRHGPEEEREPEPAIAESAPPAQAPPLRVNSAAGVLALQRSAGNRAVRAMLAREDDEETTTATAPAKTDEQLFDDAIKANDYAKAAELIVKLPKSIDKMSALSADQMYKLADAASVDQLRLLQDAAIRQGGWTGGLAQFAIRGKLVAKGVGPAKSAAGAAFGTLDTKIVEKTNGTATGGSYAYKIEITFLPDATVVDADEIAFVQTVRLVDTATGANKDPEQTNKNRMGADGTSIDRLGGREQGWYGMTDTGGGGSTLKPWKKSAPADAAFMMDRPSWSVPNTTWDFETSVICRSGADAGKVYATVTWGFSVDAARKIVEKERVVTNKPTAGFSSAVDRWNTQAAGPEADRNAPGQQSLPALK
jgi:hypothetical protein